MASTEEPEGRWLALLEWISNTNSTGFKLDNVWLDQGKDGNRRLLSKKGNKALIRIPREALLNLKTLRKRGFDCEENATRAVSLYVALTMGNVKAPFEVDRFFDPLVNMLPRDFSTVPLWWQVYGRDDLEEETTNDYSHLVRLLTPTLELKVRVVFKRFVEDWKAAKAMVDTLSLHEYLVAWLCVNTRCLYYEVGTGESADNITMAPVIDMLNHSFGGTEKPMRNMDGSMSFSTVPDNTELTFTYGPHDDATLLAEYGFVVRGNNNTYNYVDITEDLLRLCSKDIRALLLEHGYYGEYTIQAYPKPASESWRARTVLQLLALDNPSDIRLWLQVIKGHQSIVSEENEVRANRILLDICRNIHKSLEEKYQKLLQLEESLQVQQLDHLYRADMAIVSDLEGRLAVKV